MRRQSQRRHRGQKDNEAVDTVKDEENKVKTEDTTPEEDKTEADKDAAGSRLRTAPRSPSRSRAALRPVRARAAVRPASRSRAAAHRLVRPLRAAARPASPSSGSSSGSTSTSKPESTPAPAPKPGRHPNRRLNRPSRLLRRHPDTSVRLLRLEGARSVPPALRAIRRAAWEKARTAYGRTADLRCTPIGKTAWRPWRPLLIQ